MLPLPNALKKVLLPFACLFTGPTWQKAQVLVVGTLLTPRKRTVTSALRVMGLARRNDFAKFHQVLNRASWSALMASRGGLGLLLSAFDMGGTLVFGIDETLERRWGKKIKAKGIYRDAVRSSHSHFVKCSGLRWINLMWLAPVPLGSARLGTARSDRSSPFRAVLSGAGHSAQEAQRLGAADSSTAAPLVTRTPTRHCSRQRLQRFGFSAQLPTLATACHSRDALTLRCGSLHPGTP